MTNSDINKKTMIEALEKSLGVVTTACKAVGIARETHYRWMREDDEYKTAVDGISDIALDFAESQLHKQIQNGEVSSTIFYLKTKGKKRGYIERSEQDVRHSGGVTMIWQDAEYGHENNKENEGLKSEPGGLPIEEIQGHS